VNRRELGPHRSVSGRGSIEMKSGGPLASMVLTLVLTACASAVPSQASRSPSLTLGPSLVPPAPAGTHASSPARTVVLSPASEPTPAATGPSAVPATTAPSAPALPRDAGLPAFRHVYLVVMENREFGSIVGDASAPYINSLIARYGLATAYTAVAHPSEPNYLALFSGSTQSVTDDGIHDLGASNLADQLEAHTRSWRVFAQNVPGGCYTGASATGGADGPGTYARKHEPANSFSNIRANAVRCGQITVFSAFDPSAADFELIVPNLCNDMHDCSVGSGDAFLRSFVPRIIEGPAFADSVLFITWDEGSTDIGGGGRVATLVVSPLVVAGATSATPHSHYSLLRTIEDAWGLGCVGHACTANNLGEFFRP
jgi:hypothetical protein